MIRYGNIAAAVAALAILTAAACVSSGGRATAQQGDPAGSRLDAMEGSISELDRGVADLETRVDLLEQAPPLQPEPDPAGSDLTLVDSGPVTVTRHGQVIEGLRITSDADVALRINGYADVVVRNVEVRHSAGVGILFTGAPGITIENVNVIHTGAPPSGANAGSGRINIQCANSPDATIRNVRLAQGSSGIYLQWCHRVHMSFIEGYDFRGDYPRGQLVQWNRSDGGVLEDFSVINPLETSWPEDNINAFGSNDVVIRRGLIDGNNAPSGVGIVIEDDDQGRGAGILIEDVDAVRMGNGAFGLSRVRDVVMRRTRAKDNHCQGVGGRAAPRSGAQHWIVWPGADPDNPAPWNVQILDSQYANPCSENHIIWSASAVNVLELREADFTPRPPIELVFPWE